MRTGDGAYSEVYKVKRNSDNQVYALKKVSLNQHQVIVSAKICSVQVKMGKLSVKEKENALNEVRILASFQYAWSYLFFILISSNL